MAVPGMSAYCASKFALEGILEALGKEPKAGDAVVRIASVDQPPAHHRTQG